jgi:type VI secretion system protein VasI
MIKKTVSIISLVITTVCLSMRVVAAADPNTDIARCAAESNSVRRLECFDSMSTRFGVASPKTFTTTVSKWRVTKQTSRIDDSTNVIIVLDADSSITGWPRKTRTPSLVVGCKERKTDAYIITGMLPRVEYGTDVATVTLRFDKEKATKYHMSKSTDGEALFFGQSTGFIKSMLQHTTMLFEFVPFNSSPVMTTFDPRGLSDAVKPVKETCKW